MKHLGLEAGVFARSLYLQYVALFQWATVRGYIAYKVLLPVTQILFFVELGVYAVSFSFPVVPRGLALRGALCKGFGHG